ncbi:MAG TPA: hypothetical protein VLV87_09575 [Gammaproteobacteria bacterium]|nr:hypothetical protein [Gammaproteobacteria bacterium]
MSARAADTAAGTTVTNVASARYVDSGGSTLTQTASAAFTVQQLVNVTVTWQNTSDVPVTAGSAQQTLLFRVTNTGNGTDTFKLTDALVTPGGTSFTPSSCQIYFDTAGTGIYASSDVLYTAGSNDPQLSQNAGINMLVVCNVPSTAADTALGEMQLTATSKTATGSFGTVSAGAGVSGVDAVVGATGGAGGSTGIYQVHQVALAYTQRATVTSPGGGNRAVSGATIEYILTVQPSGTASANSLVITDPVPANTTFVSGSILLNGAAVTPAVGDYNVTTPGAVTVKLGNLAGTASAQVVKFQVTIN